MASSLSEVATDTLIHMVCFLPVKDFINCRVTCELFKTITDCNVNPYINNYYWSFACKSICNNINRHYASKHWNIIYKQLYTKYLPTQLQVICNLTNPRFFVSHQQTSLTLHGLCQVCIDDNIEIIKMLILDKKNFPCGVETRLKIHYIYHNVCDYTYNYLKNCSLLELCFVQFMVVKVVQ